MVDARDNKQAPDDTIAGRTLQEWKVHSRRDDCLERMVPSDLRQLVGLIATLQSELAQTRRKALEEAYDAVESFDVGGLEYEAYRDQFALISDAKDTIRALIEKERG